MLGRNGHNGYLRPELSFDARDLRLACLMLATGCLPELAFDTRELTLQAHMSMHMSSLVSGDVADGQLRSALPRAGHRLTAGAIIRRS